MFPLPSYVAIPVWKALQTSGELPRHSGEPSSWPAVGTGLPLPPPLPLGLPSAWASGLFWGTAFLSFTDTAKTWPTYCVLHFHVLSFRFSCPDFPLLILHHRGTLAVPDPSPPLITAPLGTLTDAHRPPIPRNL